MSDSATLNNTPNDINRTAPLWAVLVVVLYFFSGVAALSYEVLWARLLSLQFGVSIFGVVITVAAFMAGLGVGSLLGTRIPRRYSPLLLLAVIELLVAIFAFFIPSIFSTIDHFVSVSTASLSVNAWFALQLGVALLVLFVPAMMLGLGFPLVLRAIEGQNISLGMLYGVNTFGGVLGAILPLILLPALGLVSSLYVVAGMGCVLALAFFVLSRKLGEVPNAASPTEQVSSTNSSTLSRSAIWMYAAVGAGSLMLQIAWTRLYGMLMLRTEYVMAILLAVFLLGMALGSILLRKQKADIWLTFLPIVSAFGAVASLWSLPWVAEFAATGQYESLASALWGQGLVIALCTFPVTLALGAWLPVLASYLKEHGASIGASLYGVNAVGSACGVLLVGFVFFPLIGSSGVIALAAVILLLAGMYFSSLRKKGWLAVVPLVLLALPVSSLPPVNTLLPTTLKDTQDLFKYEDAVSITHVVEQHDGQRLLLGDLQRMDASSEPTAVVSQQNQARLPLMLHPAPQTVLFLGVGTGISASGSLPYGDTLTRVGVELSQGAIEAAQNYFQQVNDGVSQGQGLLLVRDDARRYLRTSQDTYDVIIGDLFHPDLIGRSALLSVQQFYRAKMHLSNNGVFVQWVALNQFDVDSLRVVLRTFSRVFDESHLFLDGFRLALVGLTGEGVGKASSVMNNLAMLSSQARGEVTGGEGGWTWLGRYFGRVPVAAGAVQGELTPVIEYRLPRARYAGDLDLVQTLDFLLKNRPEVNEAANLLGVQRSDKEQFERAYMAVELGVRSWLASVRQRQDEAERLIRFAYSANPKDRWVGFDLADRMYGSVDQAVSAGYKRSDALQRILEIRPDHEQVLRDMLKLAQAAGNQSKIDELRQKLRQISPLAKDVAE